jgi:cellobiose-specific phosphotransferase system component IIC
MARRDGSIRSSRWSELTAQPAHLRPGTPQRLAHLYQEHVVKQCREERLLIAVSFLVMFGIVRFITASIKDRRFTWLFHNLGTSGGTHIHHLVFGIFGLLIAGYIGAAFTNDRPWGRRAVAILYGVSAALTLDEFALWLTLRDVYWTPEGEKSVYAVMAVGAVITVGVAGRGLFAAMAKDTATLVRALLGRD